MDDLVRLSASEAAGRIARGELTSEALVRAHLERIAARDREVRAWAHLSPDNAVAQARSRDSGPRIGPLHGVPVGVKDNIDTFDMPTTYGSPIYASHRPVADAACVALLRAAGAVILGKTASTEFAYKHPGPTRNPHDAARTPGGSSSGSAAAVADFQVPVATGTQTAGSVIRPAAFCGVVGFKPTFDDIPTQGAKTLAWSLDTIGALARSIDDAALLRAVMVGQPPNRVDPGRLSVIRLGLCRTAVWDEADEAEQTAVEAVARRLEVAGARLSDVALPAEAGDIQEIHRTIMNFELNAALADERRRLETLLSEEMRAEGLTTGAAIPFAEYRRRRGEAEAARWAVDALFDDHDALITASAVGEANSGLHSTGSAIFNSAWSMLHVPCVTLPAAVGPHGLPLGVQFVGRRGGDARLLDIAEWARRRLS
jgi:Asp-tRNA(Asn)/Glu-tRNA(Gln) amidotransferase A subunit family amidase